MNFGRNFLLIMALALLPSPLAAQESAAPAQQPIAAPIAPAPVAADANVDAAVADNATAPADGALEATAEASDAPKYVPMDATPGVGMPTDKAIDFQEQYSDLGSRAKWINNAILLPIITVISLFVLMLLLWVVIRYRRSVNPVASKTTHNTTIEILWTGIPVLILLGIAIPSIDLLARQFEPAPKEAVTVKAIGYQWYWGFNYPDHGDFEVVANMLKEKDQVAEGERYRTDADGPKLLAVDNRMVVPAGVPIRLQTTAADVIHSFAIPSLWFKLDAVPGRLNEKALTITKPGVYFGQCSELCGALHGYMPIAIEALPPAEFAAWVKEQGGTMPGEAVAAKAAPEVQAPAKVAPAAVANPTDAG